MRPKFDKSRSKSKSSSDDSAADGLENKHE